MSLLLPTFIFLGLCMAAMSVGVLFSDKSLKGSCGNSQGKDDFESACGCVRQDNDVCPSGEENGQLVRLSLLGTPNRKR